MTRCPRITAMTAVAAAVGLALGCGSRSGDNGARSAAPGGTGAGLASTADDKADDDKAVAGAATASGDTAPTAPATELPRPRAITLKAADGVEITGTLYEAPGAEPRVMVLLFHQAGSNAGEYATIAPRLQRMGYSALAIDQRSGGDGWGRRNQTVSARGASKSYLDAYLDLEAALAWARGQGVAKIAAWGSSYSASLVYKLAAEHDGELTAILTFSPGEYMGDHMVAGWAKKVSIPIFVTSAPGREITAARAILRASPSTDKVQHEPAHGVHGSSILIEERNPHAEEVWQPVEAFLRRVLG